MLFALCVTVSGADGDEVLKNIPREVAQYLPEGDTAGEVVGNITAGAIFSATLEILRDVFPSAAKSFAAVLGLIILSSVAGVIRDGTERGELRDILSYICAACVCGASYSMICGIFDEIRSVISVLGTFLRVLIPSVGALSAAGGGIMFSSVYSGILYGAITLLESICESAVIPILKICICVSLGATAIGNENLACVSSSLKKTVATGLSFIMLIFSFVLGFRGIVAKSTDSVTLKSVKFAAARIIPVVGGAIGDAASSVFGSIAAIKGAVGGLGAVAMILIMLSPLGKLFIYKTLFDFTSAVAGVLGLSGEGKFISEMSSVCGFLMATLACVSVFFTVAVGIFASVGV